MKPGHKYTEAGVIPHTWDVTTLLDLAERKKERFDDGDWIEAEFLTEEGIRLIQTGNIGEGSFLDKKVKKYISAESFKKLRCKALQIGDLLICRLADPAGRACILPDIGEERLITAVDVTIFRPQPSMADLRYLVNVFTTPRWFQRVNERCGGSTRTRIARGELGKIAIAVPPLPEQHAIAEALSDVDGLLGGLDRLIAKKRDLKQAAMQQLLTGQTRLPGFTGDWEVKTFGEIAFPRRDRIDPEQAGARSFCIELEHIESGTGHLLGSTTTGKQSSLKSAFDPGDVLFGKLRAYLRKYWRATRSGVCSTEIWVLVSKNEAVTSEFLFQIIQTDEFIDAASDSYGTHMPRSDWNVVKNYNVRVPPVSEQTAIAEVLSEMDAELAALEQRREKTRALKQAMMQELLTGRTRLV